MDYSGIELMIIYVVFSILTFAMINKNILLYIFKYKLHKTHYMKKMFV